MTSLKLSDLCNIRYGKDHKKLVDGPYPVYGSGGIMRYVEKPISQGPSVLIPRKGTLGNLFYTDGPFWTVDTLFWTEIDDKKIIPKYLYYLLKTEDLASLNIGTAVPSLSADVLNEIQLSVPEMETQKKTVALLDSIESRININNQINDYLAELADFYFKEMFNSLEANAQLSDITEVTMGQSPVGTSYNEEGKGVVFYQGRGEFGWRYPTQRLFTTEPKRMALKGDVLMSVRAPVGDLNVAFEDCCIGRGLAAIHSDHRSYVLYLMRSLKTQLDAFNGEGTVFGSINGKALKAFPIALPTITAINEFESFAKPIDKSIRYNVQENRELEKLRDSLLPKLMSGEIDVSRVDITQLNNHLSVR